MRHGREERDDVWSFPRCRRLGTGPPGPHDLGRVGTRGPQARRLREREQARAVEEERVAVEPYGAALAHVDEDRDRTRGA
jgi:hypothetical protein